MNQATEEKKEETQEAGKGDTEASGKDEQTLADKMFDGGKAERDAAEKKLEEEKSSKEEEGKPKEEGKSEEEKKAAEDAKIAEEAKKTEEEKKAEAAKPENFEFTLPEGDTLTDENKTILRELSAENKWTQEQAQTNLEAFYKMRQAEVSKAQEAHQKTMDEWIGEIKDDPKIGGPKLAESLAIADKLISKVGAKAFYEEDFTDSKGKEFKKGDPIQNEKGIHMTKFGIMLKQSGVGNHPDFVRFMVDLGGMVSEDQIVTASAAQQKKSPEELFYPNQGKS